MSLIQKYSKRSIYLMCVSIYVSAHVCACVCVEGPESAIVIYSLEAGSLLEPGPHAFLTRLEAMDSWLVL